MAYGSVNVPGVSALEFQQALNALTDEIVCGDVSTPMETSNGVALTAQDGAEIRAHRKLAQSSNERSYADMLATAATASVTRLLEQDYLAVH